MKKILAISILILLIPISAFAKYYEETSKVKTTGIIAEPIVRVQSLTENKNIQMYEETVEEYNFMVCNFFEYDEDIRISELDFKYNLEVLNTSDKFPVRIELYNSNNVEILNGGNISSDFFIHKDEKYEEQYRLVIYWDDKEDLADNTKINIKINAFQTQNQE